MAKRWLAVFTLALGGPAACGDALTLDDASTPAPTDDGGAGEASSPVADGEAPPPTCDFDAPFARFGLVQILPDSTYEVAARFSPDERTVYLQAGLGGGLGGDDLWSATRLDRTKEFDSHDFTPLAQNSTKNEGWPTVTADGLTLVFASNRPDADGGDAGFDDRLFSTTRDVPQGSFREPKPISSLDSEGSESTPYLLPTGKALYYASSSPLPLHIMRAERDDGGSYTKAEPLGDAVNLPGTADQFPVVTDDDLHILFLRGDKDGLYKVMRSSRKASTDKWDPPQEDPELYATDKYFAAPTWLSPDGCRLYYLMRTLPEGGALSAPRIYRAERDPLPTH